MAEASLARSSAVLASPLLAARHDSSIRSVTWYTQIFLMDTMLLVEITLRSIPLILSSGVSSSCLSRPAEAEVCLAWFMGSNMTAAGPRAPAAVPG